MPFTRPHVEIAIWSTSVKRGKNLAPVSKKISLKWRKLAAKQRPGLADKSHLRTLAITDHVAEQDHVIGWEQAKVIGTEEDIKDGSRRRLK